MRPIRYVFLHSGHSFSQFATRENVAASLADTLWALLDSWKWDPFIGRRLDQMSGLKLESSFS